MTDRNVDHILSQCNRFVPLHYRQSVREYLLELAEFTAEDVRPDRYGEGKLIADFEAEIATLLGKPAAVFMPSGTMAQQIALRIWAERTHNRTVAFHPTCHLEMHEQMAYRELHDLSSILVGGRNALMTLDDLKAARTPIGTLLLELPQREIGGVLPAWEDLVVLTQWAREQGMILHLDGARLWETRTFYQREYAEIASLFDTVYVSFYKILNGIAGAVLAGPTEIIREARLWQRRHGGNLPRMYPYVLGAQKGLRDHLPQIDLYVQKAAEIALTLPLMAHGIEVLPSPPQTNMMHLYLRGNKERLWEATLDIAEDTGVWLSYGFSPSSLPNFSIMELTIGNAALDIPTHAIVGLFAELMRRAEA